MRYSVRLLDVVAIAISILPIAQVSGSARDLKNADLQFPSIFEQPQHSVDEIASFQLLAGGAAPTLRVISPEEEWERQVEGWERRREALEKQLQACEEDSCDARVETVSELSNIYFELGEYQKVTALLSQQLNEAKTA